MFVWCVFLVSGFFGGEKMWFDYRLKISYFASSLRKLCFREKIFFRDISVRVLRIV